MTCLELNQRLLAYQAGDLPEGARRTLESHAAECSCCRELVRTYRATVELSAAMADVPVPAAVVAAVEALLRRRGRPESR